ncbi:exo-alpha-sialidase [Phragmitibacter flavus]|uniref:exo-alpha-sialidase n=1 Tax=Phragmitibacter flavus TaxID=2576071 RepID=A0A5R8KB60_9BACT|nr:sialidase family protein [Phragmitibacter flavus]TLD69155.1 exo-alpha-sialidase [Phragmitibacter flavus]
MIIRSISISAVFAIGCSLASLQASPPKKDRGHGHGEAPALRGTHAIDVATQGQNLHLLTAEFDAHSPNPKLLYLGSTDQGETWSPPVHINPTQSHPQGAHRGMDPQIAASNTALIAVWMTPGTGLFGSGPMTTAISTDKGKTWQPGPNPSDNHNTDGEGFIDITADSNGHFHLVWLDNRKDQRGLRYSKSTDNGKTWSPNQTLDPETCECCWNTIIAGPDNTLAVMYRDKNPRDMALIISRDSGKTWEPSQPLGKFDWNFEGCPHVGGSLAISGNHWHATVWTGAAPNPGTYHLQSTDAGKTWSTTQKIADVTSTHPTIAITETGLLQLSTTYQTEQGPSIQTFTSDDQGKTWSRPQILSTPGTNASHPLTIPLGKTLNHFWTETPPHQPTIWRTAIKTK